MSKLFDEQLNDLLRELEADIDLWGAAIRMKVSGDLPSSYNVRSISAYSDEAWRQGFARCLAEVRRLSKDANRSVSRYRVETGTAGFVKLFKDGERITPKNFAIELAETSR